MSATNIRLVGGPADLRNRQREVEALPERLTVPFRAGYEHFQRSGEQADAGQDESGVTYVWEYHTSIAE